MDEGPEKVYGFFSGRRSALQGRATLQDSEVLSVFGAIPDVPFHHGPMHRCLEHISSPFPLENLFLVPGL